jgi:hypothetical protein
MADNTILTPGC